MSSAIHPTPSERPLNPPSRRSQIAQKKRDDADRAREYRKRQAEKAQAQAARALLNEQLVDALAEAIQSVEFTRAEKPILERFMTQFYELAVARLKAGNVEKPVAHLRERLRLRSRQETSGRVTVASRDGETVPQAQF